MWGGLRHLPDFAVSLRFLLRAPVQPAHPVQASAVSRGPLLRRRA